MLCGSSPGVHEKLHDLPEMSRVAFGRRAGRRQDERETGTLAKHLSTLRYAQNLFGRKFGEPASVNLKFVAYMWFAFSYFFPDLNEKEKKSDGCTCHTFLHDTLTFVWILGVREQRYLDIKSKQQFKSQMFGQRSLKPHRVD